MAVTHFIEYKRDSEKKLKQEEEYLIPMTVRTRHFQVVVDDPATAHSDIYGHADCPRLFEPHPEDDGVICKSVKPDQGDDDNSYTYELVATYDDEYNGANPEQPEDGNPLNRPVVIAGDFSEYDQLIAVDVDGNPLVNTAGSLINTTRKAGALRFSMTKNYPALDLPMLKAYKNAINSDVWFGQGIQTVRIANVGFSRQIEPWQVSEDVTIKMVFWQYTFVFEVAETGFGSDGTWKKYIASQGVYQSPSPGLLVPIYDEEDGMRVSEPQNLDSAGALTTGPAYVFSINIYRPLPFAALGLL